MKKWIFISILYAIGLFGCSEATKVATPVAIINTATDIPTKVVIASPLPTSTQTPDTPTPILDPTIQVAATLYEQTQVAQKEAVKATQRAMDGFKNTFNGICDNAPHYRTELSPDGNWLAQDCFSDKFQVIRKDNSAIWVVKYDQIFETENMYGSVFPVHWSINDNFLYFSQYSCCADNDTMTNGNMLFRLDLKTGDWKMIMGGYFNHYSFSTTGRRLLYIINDQAATGRPLVIHIRDLNSGTEKEFTFSEFEQAGNVSWSQDGTRLAITAKTGNIFEENQLFSIVEINLKDDTSKVIMRDNKGWIRVIHWFDNDILTIEKYSYYGANNQYYKIAEQIYYDLNSNEFTTSTPSP